MKLSIIEHQDLGCVRTQMIKGEPWFIAKDVCDILEIKKTDSAIRSLEDFERMLIVMGTPGGDQKMTAVNESGLYCLIFQSRKPAARKFKRWVTSEVLPSLRKYGKYVIPGSIEERREESQLEKREKKEMLREISSHLTRTDECIIGKKFFIESWDVSRVLRGDREDVTVLVECIERATRNANAARKLRNSEVRRQITAILRGVDVVPFVLN